MKKIELEIVALSSSAKAAHYYAVVLGEINGLRRLPIVIGAFEAQAIVVALEKMKPSRPLTHDLFYSLMVSFDIELVHVLIHKLKDRVFYARLYCKKGEDIIEMDSRTSDAIALAVRADCPIYTYENIIKAAGLLMDEPLTQPSEADKKVETADVNPKKNPQRDLSKMSVADLNQLLEKVLAEEDYMKAVAIRDELQRRKEK